MFGHQDDQSNQFQMPQPADDGAANNQGTPQVPSMPPPISPPMGSQGGDDSWQHPGIPLEGDQSAQPMPAAQVGQMDQQQPNDMPDPGQEPGQSDQMGQGDQNDQGQEQEESVSLQNDSQPVDNQQPQNPMPSTEDLMQIKQEAMTQLSPLVNHLDQTPEEKFRTTMMMIQASDDQSMLRSAFDAAQNISDEKVRAQALLDVINEINYFTQHQPNSQQ